MLKVYKKLFKEEGHLYVMPTENETLKALRKEVFFGSNAIDWHKSSSGLYLDITRYSPSMNRCSNSDSVETNELDISFGKGKNVWHIDTLMTKAKNKLYLLVNEGNAGKFLTDSEIEDLINKEKHVVSNSKDKFDINATLFVQELDENYKLVNYINGFKNFSKFDGIKSSEIHPKVLSEAILACEEQIELITKNLTNEEEFKDFEGYFKGLKFKDNPSYLVMKFFKSPEVAVDDIRGIYTDYLKGNIKFYENLLKKLK